MNVSGCIGQLAAGLADCCKHLAAGSQSETESRRSMADHVLDEEPLSLLSSADIIKFRHSAIRMEGRATIVVSGRAEDFRENMCESKRLAKRTIEKLTKHDC